MWSTRTTKIRITHATLTLTYWPENGMWHMVPSWVVSVPHMNMIYEIGNEPQSGHSMWDGQTDRRMDGVKPIYPNIYTNIGNFVLSIFLMKIITPPSAHYKITLLSTNCSQLRFHLYFLLTYQNQCWNIVNWTLGNKLQWNLNWNTYIFSFTKMHLKLSSAKWQPFCLCLNVL